MIEQNSIDIPKIQLSLCMIVKNEEKNLGSCLDSIKDIVDEMIILDTGSSDNTVQIAKSFGAEIHNFEWCNDFPSSGVILGVGRENHQDIQRQSNRKAFDLDVTFLHDVEKTDLNLGGQVRKFIHGEDSPVSSGQQAKMDVLVS